jgi:hypothetical protein
MGITEPLIRLEQAKLGFVEAQRDNLARLCRENLIGILDSEPFVRSESRKATLNFLLYVALLRSNLLGI